MERSTDRAFVAPSGVSDSQPPRFGSYLGLFFMVAILGILSFAILRGSGTTDAFHRLEPGMSPTQVAALLGAPRTENAQGERIIQTWKIPDGQIFEVEFRNGKLTDKRKSDRETAGDRRSR